jgi:lipopolysaccharide transport system permease protein
MEDRKCFIMNQLEERVIEGGKRKIFDWNELWEYRELFYFFSWRDIKIKYKQTVLGFLWAILQPFLMMVIFTFFFGRALKIESGEIPYPVFVFSGLMLWNFFSSALTSSSNSMVNNSSIIKKIYFPRLVIPVAAIFVSIFDFLMTFVLFIALLIYYQQPVSIMALWCWPIAVLLGVVGVLGPGSLIAALNVKYRDFRYVIPFLVQVLFFLTPVLYPVGFLNSQILQYIIACSPMYAAIELFRVPLYQEIHLESGFLLISIISSFGLLSIGLIYFKNTEDFFADLA